MAVRQNKRKGINLTKMVEDLKETFDLNKITDELVNSLADIGKELILRAYHTRGFFNRTFNLRDSYVSAVYVKGRLRADSIRYVGKELADVAKRINNQYISGREEADEFIRGVPKNKNDYIRLVIGAAMPYGKTLEKRGYAVISHIGLDLDTVKQMGISVAVNGVKLKITNKLFRREKA
jgi:hypothetical protein